MEELYFVTSNKNKVTEAEAILSIPITLVDIEVDEIQEMDLSKVVKKKVEEAFSLVKKPVFVDDVGMYVEAWNGFPGPFIKFLQHAGNLNELLLKWIALETNKRAVITGSIGYHDGKMTHVFRGEVPGTIVNSRGENGWGFDPIFIPDGYERTWSEMTVDEKNTTSHRRKALDQFKKFLNTQGKK